MERKIRVKVVDQTGDSVSLLTETEANNMIHAHGGYLAYDGETNEQLREIGPGTKEVVLTKPIVAG